MDVLLLWLPMLALGAALGFFGGIFGIGGGIIAIPILLLLFSMDQATAQGTAAAMMVPNLVMAWWRYAQSNAIGISKQTAITALVATLVTWASASFAQSVNQGLLQALFALFLLVIGVSRLISTHKGSIVPNTKNNFMPLVGVASGSCMGLLGVGGGLIATPMLTSIFGMGQRAAQSVALALVTPSAAATLATYAAHDRVDWPLGLVLAFGGVCTVSYGVKVAHSWSDRTLKRSFGMMLIAMGLILLAKLLL